MNFSEHVFRYCERGANEALLAEPNNVISNVAFLFAALIGLQLLLWRPREERSADHYLLVFLVLAIGSGSLVFHLFSTEGTELLDVVPIGLFILVYLGFALNRFLGVPVGVTVLLVIGFIAIMAMTGQVRCWDGVVGLPGFEIQGAKPCLNGSIFYLPALGALIIVGLLAEERRHRAAPYLLCAAAIGGIIIHGMLPLARPISACRRGATMPEYSIMLALIAVVLIVGVSALAQSLKGSYTKVNDHVVAAVADHDAAAAP